MTFKMLEMCTLVFESQPVKKRCYRTGNVNLEPSPQRITLSLSNPRSGRINESVHSYLHVLSRPERH